jgi:hypothetical protein
MVLDHFTPDYCIKKEIRRSHINSMAQLSLQQITSRLYEYPCPPRSHLSRRRRSKYITGNGLAKIGKVVLDAVMPNVRIPSFILLLIKSKQLITNYRELVLSLFKLAHM